MYPCHSTDVTHMSLCDNMVNLYVQLQLQLPISTLLFTHTYTRRAISYRPLYSISFSPCYHLYHCAPASTSTSASVPHQVYIMLSLWISPLLISHGLPSLYSIYILAVVSRLFRPLTLILIVQASDK